MRRVVLARVTESLDRTRLQLNDFLSEELRYPKGFPCPFVRPAVLIHEVRKVRIEAGLPAGRACRAPEGLVHPLGSLTSRTKQRFGVLDADVELTGLATVCADGTYASEPYSAVLKSWYGGMIPVGLESLGRSPLP